VTAEPVHPADGTAAGTDTGSGRPLALVEAARPDGSRLARLRHPDRRVLTGLVTALIVAGVFGFALPRVASYGTVWHDLAGVEPPGLIFIGVTLIANQVATWLMVGSALPSVRLRDAATMNLGSTAVANTVPAGGAVAMGVSWAMLSSWEVTTSAFVRYTLVSGVWNVFVRLGLPVVAVAILAVTGTPSTALQAAAWAGAGLLAAFAAVLWAVLRSESVASRAGRIAGRVAGACCRLARRRPPEPLADRMLDFRASTMELLTGRGLRITLTTLASHLSLWLVLLACLRSLGVSAALVSWPASLAAFAFARLLSALPLTPGGVGVMELGLTGPLVAGLAPSAAARVAAAVLLFRALTYLLSVPLGAGAYVWWRWQVRSRRAAGATGQGPPPASRPAPRPALPPVVASPELRVLAARAEQQVRPLPRVIPGEPD
jgi:uncharacterized protein (TIRG00374 family)